VQKVKTILEKYSRWQPLSEYIERIEGYSNTDFTVCVENSKSLLESIAKEICQQKNQPLAGNESVSKVLGLSFGCLGYAPSDTIRQIGTAIANIGQQMGNFRNEIGATAHGKTLDELRNRETTIHDLTGDFLLQSTELVACFLIEAFETDNPLKQEEVPVKFQDNPEFNDYWDDIYGELVMSEDYTYMASEVLFYVDNEAYKTELKEYKKLPKDETGNGE
jgi:hypothetical protein